MTKIHIGKDGKPSACNATVRDCPIGGTHYESMRDAMTAVNEAEFGGGLLTKELLSIQASQVLDERGENEDWKDEHGSLWQGSTLVLSRNEESHALAQEVAKIQEERQWLQAYGVVQDKQGNPVSHEVTKRVLDPSLVAANAHRIYDYLDENGLDNDSTTREVAFSLAAEKLGRDYDDFYNAWLDQKPMATEPEALREREVARQNAEQETYVREVLFDEYQAKYDAAPSNADKVQVMNEWGAKHNASVAAQEAATRDPRHRYGPNRESKEAAQRLQDIARLERKGRLEQSLAQTADSRKEAITHLNEATRISQELHRLKAEHRAHEASKVRKGPKELDPQMLEALKMKYLKKFKMPFEESGLSVGELLQMAQRGEL